MKQHFLLKFDITVRYKDFSTYMRLRLSVWTADIFLIKRTAIQLLAEFIGRQKIRLVGVGVSRLKETDSRQTMITDFA
jgi:DNA polymerase IV (DinB-like DNA polymerase)